MRVLMWCSMVAAANAVACEPGRGPVPQPVHVQPLFAGGEPGSGGGQHARFLPGTDRVVVGTRDRLRLLDWRAGRVTELPADGLIFGWLGASADARYVVASSGLTLHAWDLKTQQPAGQIKSEHYFLGIQPAGPKGGVYVLNTERAELIHWDVADGRSDKVLDVGLSPAVPPDRFGDTGYGLAVHDGRVAAVTIRPGFAVVDLAAKAVTKFVTLPGVGSIKYLAFSADGSRLVVNHLNELFVFDTAKWEQVAKFRVADRATNLGEVAFTPDGKTIVVGTAPGARNAGGRPVGVTAFDAATGRHLGYFQTHPDYPPSLSVSSDGKHLATAGADGVKIWDLAAIVANFRAAAR